MTKRLNIEIFQKIAKKRGGKCISRVYINGRTLLRWQCKQGHKWEAVPDSIRGSKQRKGTWCGKCSNNNPGTLNKLKAHAKYKQGKCLEASYLGARVPHLWECKFGHSWLSTPDNTINKGRWCPECAQKKKYTIEQMNTFAKNRGGKCLSKKYVNNVSPLFWECGNRHKWKAIPSSIIRGSWCPECAHGIGERITRCYFEQIFKTKFPKYKKFGWLRNPAGNKMELDGYSEMLKIGFEHQGAHHYNLVKPFVTTLTNLKKRRSEDKLKQKLCHKHGIKLILVPEINNLILLKDLKLYLKKEFQKFDIKVPDHFKTLDIDLKKAYTKDHMSEMQALAKSRSGKFISIKYSGNLDPHIWECTNGHRFNSSPAVIKAGRWCRFCAGNVSKTIEELENAIKLKGGKCLSSEYKNAHTKVLVKCNAGHTWEAIPRNIYKGHWCPYCAGQKGISIKNFQIIAKERGGRCLSREYKNAHSKLSFRCRNDHKWMATANSVRRGSWCPFCAKSRVSIRSGKR